MAKYDNKDGVWRTIRGNRVFIRYNQSLSEALRERGYNLKKEDKKKKKESISDEYDVYEEENGYSGKGKELLRFLQFEEKDSGVEIPENLKKTLESNPDKEYIFNSNDNSLKDFKLDDSYIKDKGIRTNPDDYLGEGEFKTELRKVSNFDYTDPYGKYYKDNKGNLYKSVDNGNELYITTKAGEPLKDVDTSKFKLSDKYTDEEVRKGVKTAYIYRDESEGMSGLKRKQDYYGKEAVDEAFKWYDDNYVTIKGVSMDSEGLTYNNILKKSDYSKEALDKYAKGMQELYDRERYSGDSKSYNKKADDLLNNLIEESHNEKWNNNYRTKAINNEYALSFGDSSQNYSDTKSVSFKDKEKAVLNNEFLGDYYGKEQYEKYGDSVSSKYAGKQISKKISDSNNPNGLTTLAKETGMSNEYEAVKTLEGMVRNGKAREIDDSTYRITDTIKDNKYSGLDKALKTELDNAGDSEYNPFYKGETLENVENPRMKLRAVATNYYENVKNVDARDYEKDIDEWVESKIKDMNKKPQTLQNANVEGERQKKILLNEREKSERAVKENPFDVEYKVTINGKEVKPGDEITDFRGEKSIFRGITKPNTTFGGPNGKVVVGGEGPGQQQEFYPGVFNIEITRADGKVKEEKEPKFITRDELMSESKLIQSYINRGYSKETARKMARMQIKLRKNK